MLLCLFKIIYRAYLFIYHKTIAELPTRQCWLPNEDWWPDGKLVDYGNQTLATTLECYQIR